VAGPIHQFLSQDHARLDAAWRRATRGLTIDLAASEEFRVGLLRHIAMEETVLFVDARTRSGGEPLPVAKQLHADHAALASMLVPPPTHELLLAMREILEEHNRLEESPGGLYEMCEQFAGTEVAAVLARMHAIPPVRASQHLDEPRIHEHIARMVAARRG
jgi:hypothetical protein